MKATSIALCRVSTVKQRLEGNSLAAQEKRVYDAATYVNAPIEKFWSLNVSSRKGKNFNRRDLHEMLVYAKQHKRVRYVIVDEPDRFMRSFDEFYYWKVRFRKEAGVLLVYAAKPQLVYKDDTYSLFEEMIDVFKAEASNTERIIKTTEKMQARIAAGYYPGVPKQGYQRTLTPGLHAPHEPQWSMLRTAFNELLSQEYSLHEVLKRLHVHGYKTTYGKDLDMERFKTILRDPYYAGVCHMSSWPTNPHGLHKAMITREQHERVQEIVSGKKKFVRQQFNSKYRLSNLMDCTECLNNEHAHHPRLVGYDHNNGKQGSKRKVYESYRTRCCKREFKRQAVHDELNTILEPLVIEPKRREEFIAALRVVWQQSQQENTRYIQTLEQRHKELTNNKDNLVMAMAIGKISEVDGNSALAMIKGEIAKVADELAEAQDVEKDFIEFTAFTMDFIDQLQRNWWELDQKHLRWCKQLLFPDGFSISHDGKVHTPKISEFYRVATMKKDSEESDFSALVTHAQKSLHPLKQEAMRWRGIVGILFETNKL